jgi:hypothetical protein
LLEKCNAENLQDFAQTWLEIQLFLDNRYQDIDPDCNPDLSLHCVLGGAEKCFDLQVLLDLFEEKFSLPTTFVKLNNCQGRQGKIVCEKYESFVGFGIEVTDTTKERRVILRSIITVESYSLVASQPSIFVDLLIVKATIIEITFGSGDKERQVLSEGIKTSKIDVTTIHDVERT